MFPLFLQGQIMTSYSEAFGLSGGTESTSGNYKTHVFTSSGTLKVSGEGSAEVLVVAGGGSGGENGGFGGGGGGGGGVVYKSSFYLIEKSYPLHTSNAFGNSVTVGVGASVSDSNYVSRIAARTGWTITNKGINGNELANFFANMYGITVGANYSSTSLLGYNDMTHFGDGDSSLTCFRRMIYSAMVWLSVPRANMVLAQSGSVTYAGTWSNLGTYGGAMTKYSNTNGSTATFSLTGTTIFIDILQSFTETRKINVTIDGVNKGSFDGNDFTRPRVSIGYAPYLLRFTGLSNSAHTVVLTIENGTGYAYFNWATATNGTNLYPTTYSYLGNCIKMNAAGYATVQAGFGNGSDAAVNRYNQIMDTCVRNLSADGLNVKLVDVCSAYNTTTDVGADNIHPNDLGYRHIATSFLNVLGIPFPGYITITVGNGGTHGTPGTNGDNSILGSLVSVGGGRGGSGSGSNPNGFNGGSAGGGGSGFNNSYNQGLTGTPTSGQGNNGGSGNVKATTAANVSGGGGGGAGSAGSNATNGYGGNGGAGIDYSSSFGTGVGASGWFSGGGGGGGKYTNGTGDGGTGSHGGGKGGYYMTSGANGTANTGGGGGGMGQGTAGDGGSGIVIVKWKYQ